jgi:UDP-N-acetylmuramate--alanine ligase
MERAFGTFAGRADTALIGTADPGSERVAAMATGARIWRFGLAGVELQVGAPVATALGSQAAVRLPSGRTVQLRLSVPGVHNVLNAAAALGVVHALDGEVDAALDALARFAGVGRRFERKGQAAGVTLIDDYAHHATELNATLAAARQAFPGRRLVAVFQPHLYSRTAAQYGQMARALEAADVVFVTEVYAAREAPIAGVSGRLVTEAMARAGRKATFVPERAQLAPTLGSAVQSGDVVLTLGAGDITEIGPELLDGLRSREAEDRRQEP